MKIGLQDATARYPRLTAALCDRCLLTESEAATALYGVANASSNVGSEAVMHFGGPVACVRAAFRGRAKARRYSGSPIWASWRNKPEGKHSAGSWWEPTWPDRIAQMRKIAYELCGSDVEGDVAIDQQVIEKMAPSDHKFLWFVRTLGTSLENLSLPRARQSVGAIANSVSWIGIFLVDLNRGVVKISAAQALEIAAKSHPYRVIGDNTVAGPANGARGTLARFAAKPVFGRVDEFDVVIHIEGFSWSVMQCVRPHLRREELNLIEQTILDHLVTKRGSLFAKIREIQYQVTPEISLSAQRFRQFYQSPELHHFPRFSYRENGVQHFSPWLPTETGDVDVANKWLPDFKKALKAIRGDLRGLKLSVTS